jgi:hypothetical protein
MEKIDQKTCPKLWLAVLVGVVLGIVGLVGLRLVMADDHAVHHHANFAIFVNGEREQFESFTYYEEVQACSDEYSGSPLSRVHMHDYVSNVVHVHDQAVTWGNFFENIGFSVGDSVLETADEVFVDDQPEELVYLLNGERVGSVANRVINSEDVLLVHYGSGDEDEIASQLEAIDQDAAGYNERDDPSSCSGSGHDGFWHRLREAVI